MAKTPCGIYHVVAKKNHGKTKTRDSSNVNPTSENPSKLYLACFPRWRASHTCHRHLLAWTARPAGRFSNAKVKDTHVAQHSGGNFIHGKRRVDSLEGFQFALEKDIKILLISLGIPRLQPLDIMLCGKSCKRIVKQQPSKGGIHGNHVRFWTPLGTCRKDTLQPQAVPASVLLLLQLLIRPGKRTSVTCRLAYEHLPMYLCRYQWGLVLCLFNVQGKLYLALRHCKMQSWRTYMLRTNNIRISLGKSMHMWLVQKTEG
jgi:hypothetical protein